MITGMGVGGFNCMLLNNTNSALPMNLCFVAHLSHLSGHHYFCIEKSFLCVVTNLHALYIKRSGTFVLINQTEPLVYGVLFINISLMFFFQ